MKKFISLSIIALLSAGTLSAMNASRSFFSVKPVQVPMARQNLLVDQAHNTGRAIGMKNFQVSVFGGVSTNADDLARYFMMGKTELRVNNQIPTAGTDLELSFQQDIQATNFNIDTNDAAENFESTIKMQPKQKFYGASLSFRMPFRNRFWFAAELPIVHVENDLNLTEVPGVAANATGQTGIQNDLTVANMIEGFKNPSMKYGRIDGAQNKTGLADLTLKFGYEPMMFNRNDMYMSPYLGVILPTGNKAEAVYMFEPIVGNGGHFGIMTGAHGEFKVCNMKSGALWASYRIENQYLFQNTQKRTMDLIRNGAWSRYLNMYNNEADRALDAPETRNYGTNIMTQDVNVTPGYFGNIDMSFNYVCDKWSATLGYAVHARQGEKIELKNAWTEDKMIAAQSDDNYVNPFATIGDGYTGLNITAAPFVTIKQADIDFNSAAHPGGVSYTAYASIGAMCPQHEQTNFELGASYEFARDNTAMDRVCGWIKAQVSF